MKQVVWLIAAFMLTTASFATPPSMIHKLSTAWKAEQAMHAKEAKNDITIVYGGADISARPMVVPTKTIA